MRGCMQGWGECVDACKDGVNASMHAWMGQMCQCMQGWGECVDACMDGVNAWMHAGTHAVQNSEVHCARVNFASE
jgi:hypothetical protein